MRGEISAQKRLIHESTLRRGARKTGPKSESGRESAFVGTGSDHYQSGVHPLGNGAGALRSQGGGPE